MPTRLDHTMPRGRWAVLAVCAAAGLAYLGIGLAHGNTASGFIGLAIMLAYGAVLLAFGRRSEVLGLLAGSGSDERRAQIQLRATAATAHVLVLVLVAGAMWTLATGSRYAAVFCGLCAVGGASFIAATAWFARHC